ncbi:porin [Aureibaculum sp. 2210JD6-5]|uniref:porin n=1 Tax=Aureibaculum sp. 2210JD6-5 TaxID=3103957 RepID=UPI002AAD9EC8|nr:porin [Aureibaculum sp. 2210JD6-5]MDY7396587.1 porin [Aureibaculum sp. 2210JD6-5]
MKKINLLCGLLIVINLTNLNAQQDTVPQQINAAQRLISTNVNNGVIVGGYGEITYNQPEGDNGELDVQRLVLLLGYKFSDKVQFVTEIEFEHVKEVYVEQAFVNYNVADNFNIRGGLMLVPMGIVNEYHEPTTFNGTERPAVDNVIVPTTWREIGIGVNGRLPNLNLGYQAYVFNGFKSTNDSGEGGISGILNGSNGLRSGRQKGAQSTMSSPTFASKIDYYGLPGLRLGLSGYFGKTQTDDGLESLDGSTIGISMLGVDARYTYQRFSARGQFIYASLSDTEAYNNTTGKDLGSALQGWYVEGAYNLLPQHNKQKLVAFARYENYNTHADVAGNLAINDAYNRTDITTGLSYHIAPGVVVKGDYQFRDNALSGDTIKDRLNFGIGVWF